MCALMIAKYIPSDALICLHSHLCVCTCQKKNEKATFFIVNFIDLLYIKVVNKYCVPTTYYLLTLCAPTHLLALDTC